MNCRLVSHLCYSQGRWLMWLTFDTVCSPPRVSSILSTLFTTAGYSTHTSLLARSSTVDELPGTLASSVCPDRLSSFRVKSSFITLDSAMLDLLLSIFNRPHQYNWTNDDIHERTKCFWNCPSFPEAWTCVQVQNTSGWKWTCTRIVPHVDEPNRR